MYGYEMRVRANPHFFIAQKHETNHFGGGTLLAENIKSMMKSGQEKYV
jgi:hypothetical protein